MKKLLALVALLAMAGQAYGEGAEFSHNGEFRLRYQSDSNITGDKDTAPTSQNKWDHRFLWGTTFRAGEKFTGQLTLIHNATWGHSQLGVGGTGDTGLGLHNGISNAENMLLVNEAYGAWMINDSTNLKFGRGGMTLANGKVVSRNDWEPVPTSFEGGIITWDQEMFNLNFYGVRFAEWSNGTASTTASDPEVNSFGLSLNWKGLPDFLKMANLHVIQVNADANPATAAAFSTDGGEERLRYGLTLAGDSNGIDYDITYAANTGELRSSTGNVDREGNMIDAEIGYTLENVMNLRIHVGYHTDSGTEAGASKVETYDSYFYERHANAGLMDIFLWGNLTYLHFGFKLEPMEDLTVGADYLMFSMTEETGAISANTNGSSFAVTSSAARSDDALGDEIDLWVTKKYDGGFSLTARAGMFSPGDVFKPGQEDDYTQLFLEGKMTF